MKNTCAPVAPVNPFPYDYHHLRCQDCRIPITQDPGIHPDRTQGLWDETHGQFVCLTCHSTREVRCDQCQQWGERRSYIEGLHEEYECHTCWDARMADVVLAA